MTPPQGFSVKLSRDAADRQVGFLARRAGVSDSAVVSDELRLVQSQRMDDGSSSSVVFRGEAIPFPFAGSCVDQAAVGKPRSAFGFVMEGNKLFSNIKGDGRLFPAQEAAVRCSLYVSQSRVEQDGSNVRIQDWNVDGNGDSVSGGDRSGRDEEEDDGVDDNELDDGDDEVDGLVTADMGNTNMNSSTSSGSVQSNSEKICSNKPNVEEQLACFGLSRADVANCGNEMRESSGELQHRCEGGNDFENTIAVVEPVPFCGQIFHGGDGVTTSHKTFGGDDVHFFSSRREVSLPVYPGESLRAHLSDPVTGILMDDALILPCGHSFGIGGMQHVQRMKACFKCSIPISEDSIRPNLALRAAVQAFLREEESHSLRISKRRRERFELDKYSYDDQLSMDSRSRGVQFPFSISDRVIIKGNKRTPERFVGRMAVVTTQCLNGWYVVKTLDNAESVKLQYRSLAKVADDSCNFVGSKAAPSSWL